MTEKPKYDPQIHHRRSIRLQEYDYSQAGLYFITICCHEKKSFFGTIENGEMILNDMGKIAEQCWKLLPERFSNVELDIFQIMPNHLHGIILLNDIHNSASNVGAGLAPALRNVNTASEYLNAAPIGQPQGIAPTKHSIGDIIGSYKSLVAKNCLDDFKQKSLSTDKNLHMGKLWQRNYFEHIIRNEESYYTIATYIANNPINWKQDKLYS